MHDGVCKKRMSGWTNIIPMKRLPCSINRMPVTCRALDQAGRDTAGPARAVFLRTDPPSVAELETELYAIPKQADFRRQADEAGPAGFFQGRLHHADRQGDRPPAFYLSLGG